MTPFIAFFSLAAMALLAEKALARARNPRHQMIAAGVVAAVVAIGIFDEADAAVPLNRRQDEARRDWHATASFIRALETGFPPARWFFSCRC